MIGWPVLGMILEASGFIVEELWQSMKSKVIGACLGSLIKVNDPNFGVDASIYTIIAVCKSKNSQLLTS
jgi:hypothetical protein